MKINLFCIALFASMFISCCENCDNECLPGPPTEPEHPIKIPSVEDLIEISEPNMIVGTNTWKAIAYGKGDYDNGKYVAVSYDLADDWNIFNPNTNGHIATSIDGTNWTILALGEISGLSAVAYGNNTFVAVGDNGYTLASMYGGEWKTTRETAYINGSSSYLYFNDIAFGNGKFVAVSSSAISTSTYGNLWSTKQVSSNENRYITWYGITYGNGKFIALGNNNYMTSSPDGDTWTTPKQVGTNMPNKAVVYGNNKFIAVGNLGYIAYSIDGNTWATPKQVGTNTWYDVIYSNGKFIAVGSSYVTTSADGITWTTPTKMKDEYGNPITQVINAIVAMP